MERLFAYLEHLRPGDRLIFVGILIIFFTASISFIVDINRLFLVEKPLRGSVFTEAFSGSPRFLNPVLAVTQTDKDLVSLVYSGLLRVDEQGALVPDLAESITVSEDGKQYTVILKDGLQWSDGTPLTTDDVAFTISLIQDPLMTSPLRVLFANISMSVVDSRELVISLPDADVAFMETLVFGIMPSHIWSSVSFDNMPYHEGNAMPVGTGPYTVSRVVTDKDGTPKEYIFTPNKYALRNPLMTFHARFYADDTARMTALSLGEVDTVAGINTQEDDLLKISSTHNIITRVLPRTFGLFFNQKNNPALLDIFAREALAMIVDRDALVRDVLHGYGVSTDEPLPVGFKDSKEDTLSQGENSGYERARAHLQKGGWVFDEGLRVWNKKINGATTTLAFSIATLNATVFTETATRIEQQFAGLGIPVTIKSYERSDMSGTVIRNRDYEALLYGTAFGRSRDIYPFWHSSRRTDPGLNVSLYANIVADNALTAMREATTTDAYHTAYTTFMSAFRTDTPAIFLYSPQFVYIIAKDIAVSLPERVMDQTERFANVSSWYRETEYVWSIFNEKNN